MIDEETYWNDSAVVDGDYEELPGLVSDVAVVEQLEFVAWLY